MSIYSLTVVISNEFGLKLDSDKINLKIESLFFPNKTIILNSIEYHYNKTYSFYYDIFLLMINVINRISIPLSCNTLYYNDNFCIDHKDIFISIVKE